MIKETDIQTHVIFVAAFIQKGDKFLLSKRSKTDPQAGGMWSIPGGKVESEVGGNVVEKTIAKEIEEEVGVKIKNTVSYLGSDAFIRVSGHHVVGLTFIAYWESGVAKPLEDQEEVAWYTLEELNRLPDLPKYLQNGIKLLSNFLKNDL